MKSGKPWKPKHFDEFFTQKFWTIFLVKSVPIFFSYLVHLGNCTITRMAQYLKIAQKVAFNMASEASYVYILSGQKLIKNDQFWRVFDNLSLAVKTVLPDRSILKVQKLVEKAKIEKCDIFKHFSSSLCSFWSESPWVSLSAKKTGSKSYSVQQRKTALREYFFTIQKVLFIMKGIHYYCTTHAWVRECQFL